MEGTTVVAFLSLLFAIASTVVVLYYATKALKHGNASPLRVESFEKLSGDDSPGFHQAEARIELEQLQFSVFRPNSIEAQSWRKLLFFAHPGSFSAAKETRGESTFEEVTDQARQVLGDVDYDFGVVSVDSDRGVSRSNDLLVIPDVAGVVFDPPKGVIQWDAAIHRLEFNVRAQSPALKNSYRGTIAVYLGSLIIADVPLVFRTRRSTRDDNRDYAIAKSSPYRRIFPSYAHQDRGVVRVFQEYAAALGDDYMQDVLILRAGEEWNRRLEEAIEVADVFQLFWSSNSMRSIFVRSEWEHALSLGRNGFVRPVYWEHEIASDPQAGLPPPALKKLHFHHLAVGSLVPRADGLPDHETENPVNRRANFSARESSRSRAGRGRKHVLGLLALVVFGALAELIRLDMVSSVAVDELARSQLQRAMGLFRYPSCPRSDFEFQPHAHRDWVIRVSFHPAQIEELIRSVGETVDKHGLKEVHWHYWLPPPQDDDAANSSDTLGQDLHYMDICIDSERDALAIAAALYGGHEDLCVVLPSRPQSSPGHLAPGE